jgi:UDPglucose 6-dehydrogenase
MIRLGVVGIGYVGGAVVAGFTKVHGVQIVTCDSNPDKHADYLTERELANNADIIFVSVPTPVGKTGECDISMVEKVVREISEANACKEVVIKSTVPPGTTLSLAEKYRNLNIIFNPEFLTEANYILDFKSQDKIILGVPHTEGERALPAARLYKNAFPTTQTYIVDSNVAEMFKYTSNIFLATKVTFANQIHKLCKASGIDYNEVAKLARKEVRLGESHWTVPGPDGKYGFGGSCFPKDLSALIAFAEEVGEDTAFLTAVQTACKYHRGDDV